MSERPTKEEMERFHDLAMRLLQRDGEYEDRGEDGFWMWISVDELRITFHGGYSVLDATIGSGVDCIYVFSENHYTYNGPLVRKWIPRLEARLVLEELADV